MLCPANQPVTDPDLTQGQDATSPQVDEIGTSQDPATEQEVTLLPDNLSGAIQDPTRRQNILFFPANQPETDPDLGQGQDAIFPQVDIFGASQDPAIEQEVTLLPANQSGATQDPTRRQDTMLCPTNQNETTQDPTTGQNITPLTVSHFGNFHDPNGGQEATLLLSNQITSPLDPVRGQSRVDQPVGPQEQSAQHPTLHQNMSNQSGRLSLPDSLQTPALQTFHPTAEPLHGPSECPTRRQEAMNLPACHAKSKLHKKSFIDNITLLEKNFIVKTKRKGPLDFHDRFNLTLPPEDSILQHQLTDLITYTQDHHMVLNGKKTKKIPFINLETKDFMPQLKVEGVNGYLEVIYKLKLVGLVVTSNLTWHEHVKYTVGRINKAYQIQMLRCTSRQACDL